MLPVLDEGPAGRASRLRACALDRLARSGCFAAGKDEPCGVWAGPWGLPPHLTSALPPQPLTPSRLRDSTGLPLKSQSRVGQNPGPGAFLAVQEPRLHLQCLVGSLVAELRWHLLGPKKRKTLNRSNIVRNSIKT